MHHLTLKDPPQHLTTLGLKWDPIIQTQTPILELLGSQAFFDLLAFATLTFDLEKLISS